MKTITFNQDQKINMKSHSVEITPCSFRIPDYLKSEYKKKIEKHNNLSMYFYFLLRRYKHIAYTGGLPQYKSIKKVYQDRGLNAQQVSLRASSEDWSEFKILSEALQMSMCKLFVYFLLLDSSEIPNLLKKYFDRTIVTWPQKYRIGCIITLSSKNEFLERNFRFRRDRCIYNI
ncbi:MAG: DUF1564 family protein [Leptospiraceae bacterium]|nr:DUF1564 family protein [Leptospiraceae bacterium]